MALEQKANAVKGAALTEGEEMRKAMLSEKEERSAKRAIEADNEKLISNKRTNSKTLGERVSVRT